MRTIPELKEGTHRAKATGTLPNGRPVVVNTDGTVSVVELSNVSDAVGTAAVFNSGNSASIDAAYDAASGKIVVCYADYTIGGDGTAIVGTVSGTSISFGTPVIFEASNSTIENRIIYDANAEKVVIVFQDNSSGALGQGKAIVGTVSGTSISFGSKVAITSGQTMENFGIAYDANAQKIAISFRDYSGSNYGACVVGTVSGTSISFGSKTVFNSAITIKQGMTYDSTAQKIVIAYRDYGTSTGNAIVGTISGTSISFGSEATFQNGPVDLVNCSYNASADRTVVAYQNSVNNNITACVGTVSGTSISFGTAVEFDGNVQTFIGMAYDSNIQKTIIAYQDDSDSGRGKVITGTVSGTSISFDTPFTFDNGGSGITNVSPHLPVVGNQTVISYRDDSNSDNGTSIVFRPAGQEANLTSENYIGISQGVVAESALSIGATSVVNTGTNGGQAIAYDTNSDRVVIAYKDTSNGHGKAVVGTVSGSGITFGTPVTFNAATTTGLQPSHGIAFDSSNNKVVIVYKDNGNSSYGTAIVGTVDPSDNSISFGSEAVFESASTAFPNVVFDSSNNKVLISYSDAGDSSKGKAIVGTVSGTSISFGSAAEFEGGNVNHETLMSTFDSANNKVVIAYRDGGDSNKGKAVVATVSGTSVSFGTPVEFTASAFVHSSITFDSTSNKVILVYRDGGNSGYGTAKAGTVSGTSISFGNAIIYNSGDSQRNSVSYSPTADKSIVFFRDGAASDIGKLVEFTVSGTASSAQQFSATTTSASSSVFDPDNNVVVNAYIDEGNTTDLETVQVTGTTITRGQVASGSSATVDIIGSVSTNQSGLTAGQQYYVQTDGTIGETAADPNVFAGTAISATSLVVKT